jgi:hypothetical protein
LFGSIQVFLLRGFDVYCVFDKSAIVIDNNAYTMACSNPVPEKLANMAIRIAIAANINDNTKNKGVNFI